LHQNGTLDFVKPTTNEGTLSYISDPNDPVITTGGNNMIVYTPDGSRTSQGQMDLANPDWKTKTMDRPDVLQFVSNTIYDSVSIIGEPIAILYAKTKPLGTQLLDVSNCDFIVRIIDVCPNGRELFVCEGAVNIRARDYARAYAENKWLISNEAVDTIKWSNAKSDSIYELKFKMLPIAYSFGKGHKIKVLISSTNYPRYQSNPNIPLEDNEFFRRRPYEDKTYTYQGVTMYSRPVHQTIAFADNMPTHIILPLKGGSLSPVSTDKPHQNPNLTIYPNPANDNITIIFSEKGSFNYQMHNLLGQTIRQGKLNETTNISVSDLEAGVYLLNVVNSENKVIASQKIIIVH
jgi:putative CocE/NonD family hydrolase